MACPALLQEEVVLSMDGGMGLTSGASLGGASDRDTAEALHAMEVLSLEGSGRGRAMLRQPLSAAVTMGVGQHHY